MTACDDRRVEVEAGSDEVRIREYQSTDADATLAVFLAAVTETAAQDYTSEQISAWARRGQRDLTEWDRSRSTADTYVAVVDGDIAGFSDVNAQGHIDMMFVCPRYGHRGVGGALLAFLERRARGVGASRLSADVSITARPFFQAHGCVVEAEQHPITAGVRMTNFRMVKRLE